ncbi:MULTISPECIES: glycoside hydrolase family 9 protein [unclassified Isoptericola]|uniref:glycoside hydrolase family 9 protein n=1 Tax=unclassified Isoptericola TaxID=2623355 RepID=UPI00365FBBF6
MDAETRRGAAAATGAALLVNELGYGAGPARRVVVALADPDERVALRWGRDGTEVEVPLAAPVRTPGWSVGWHRVGELPPDMPAGEHRLRLVRGDGSEMVRTVGVGPGRWQAVAVSDVLAYFRSVRSFGEIDRKDRAAAFYDDPARPPVDARGGWLDASGDFSKFLSHLTYTDLMSPQQIPLCAWAFAAARDDLARAHPRVAAAQGSRLRDEALHGADFLVRFQAPEGYFYTGIFDALTKDLDERVVTAPLQDSVRTQRWQAAFRHGGGVAIAALARASTLDADGEFSRDRYLEAAVRGHAHLVEHNTDYLFNGVETVLDDYCAALAAAELVLAARARGAETAPFRAPLERRVANLLAAVRHDAAGRAYLVAAPDGRTYHHAAETGLPVLALLRAAEAVDAERPQLADDARRAAVDLALGALDRATAVPNPFEHPRHVVAARGDGSTMEQFFFPHENETGYWWQGENANVASLSAAASAAAAVAPAADAGRLRDWAEHLLGWVVGLNPYAACMLQGRGSGAVEYSQDFPNLPGGILNGITGGFDDESDIDFAPPGPMATGESWRWAEQWIPHSAWFLLAVSGAR